jgi:hypothetical protein
LRDFEIDFERFLAARRPNNKKHNEYEKSDKTMAAEAPTEESK